LSKNGGMKNYSFHRIAEINEEVFNRMALDDMDYFEYHQISKSKKLSITIDRIRIIESNEKNITFCVLENNNLKSVWVITKDDFDSEIFGIDVYRIVNLLLFEPNFANWNNIIDISLEHLQKVIEIRKKPSYLLIGLNTNLVSTPFILNKLISRGFYYIHTLLTYKMLREEYPTLSLKSDDSLQIRAVKESDVNDVISLAIKSFKFSRFHLDPFLDKEKANILLATSAKNSILEGFVDIMFVAEIQNRVVGYYSGRKSYIPEFDITFGEAVISAVDENYRELGIFKGLNRKLLEWFYNNSDIAEMGTYIANTPVHKTWNNNKLTIVRGVHQLSIILRP